MRASILFCILLLTILTSICKADSGVQRLDAVTDDVDLIEVNHFYDSQGRLVFDQIIYYDWNISCGMYHVRDWRLLKASSQIPLRDWRFGGYSSEWMDVKQAGVLRRVTSKQVRETWTVHDPELLAREFLSQEKRVELTRANAK